MLKKFINLFTACAVIISSTVVLLASAASDLGLFTFKRSASGYNVTLNSSADFSGIVSVEFPSTYDPGDGSTVTPSFTRVDITGNKTIRSVSIPYVGAGSSYAFEGLDALEEVTYTNDSELNFSATVFSGCSSTLKTININAASVALSNANVFNGFNINADDAKIVVINNDVKQQILKIATTIPENKIEIKVDNRPEPIINVTCDDIKYGDAKFNPSVEVTYVNAEEQTITVEDPQVKYTLFKDEDCAQQTGDPDNTATLMPNTYYLKATLTGTSDYKGGSKVIPVKVTDWADKSNLNKALNDAYAKLYTDDDHQEEADLSEYVPKAVENLKVAVNRATDYNFRNRNEKIDAENSNMMQSTLLDPKACQDEVDEVTAAINTALAELVKKADFDDSVKAKVQARYNKYVNVTETNYTSDSFEAFKTTRDEFNESYGKMGSGTLTNENALAVIEKIDEAYGNLKYKNPPTFDDLKAAIEKAEPYLKEVEKYTEDTLEALDKAITSGKSMLNDYADKGELDTNEVVETDLEDVEGGFTFKVPVVRQSDVNNAASAVNRGVSSLVTKEQREAYLDLQEKVSDVAENYSDPDLFTASSYAALTEALTAAKNVKETDKVEDIKSAAETLQKAIDGLKHVEGYLPAGEAIKYIKYGYNDPLISGVYDGKSSATQVRLTFDCAPGTNFGPYGSIELEVQSDGKQIGYAKLTGKNATSENGAKNAKAVLKLNTPLEVGQNYLLNAFTYSWQGQEYAYAVTKIEFLDDEGNILKAFNDITAAKENLKQSVEAAKKLSEDEYTAESYNKLKDAIAKAEEVIANENVTKNEVDAAAAALEEAIRGLSKKQQPTSPSPSNSNTVKPAPTTAGPKKRSNADVLKDKQAAVNKIKTVKIKKLSVKSKTKKKITVTWKKVKKAKGYQVQVSTSKKFKKSKIIFKKFTKKKTLKISSKKIKSKKTYYVRVRAYTTYNDINGKPQKVYSKWNKKLRTVKVK